MSQAERKTIAQLMITVIDRDMPHDLALIFMTGVFAMTGVLIGKTLGLVSECGFGAALLPGGVICGYALVMNVGRTIGVVALWRRFLDKVHPNR